MQANKLSSAQKRYRTTRKRQLREDAHHYTACFGAVTNPDAYRQLRRRAALEYAQLRGWITAEERWAREEEQTL